MDQNLRARDDGAQHERTEWTSAEILAACRADGGPIPLALVAPVPREITPLLRRWKRGALRYAAAKAGAPEPDVRPVLTLIRGGGRRV